MAAKQGITAQIHQYSEDTKRSLLSRAPAGIKSHSWLSNLNTTCTIKSAPPRTPEVMSMLGTKCGWLVKRNEQHVWQKRWCCVVPHTFLYYFEASPAPTKTDKDDSDNDIQTHEVWSGGGINTNIAIFTNLDQEALNNAVKDGYEEGEGGVPSRMSLYSSLPNIMGGGGGGEQALPGGEDMVAWDPEQHVNNPMTPSAASGAVDGVSGEAASKSYQFMSSNLQPVGIIDLECYSAVNRSKLNPTVLELAGDSVTNPDLRSFYFQSPSIEDAESWTKALLSDRHQSLKDETEAYRQVCESFPLQLANCSQMIDTAEGKADAMEREAYIVRSASEEGRRKVVRAVREMLERRCWDTEGSTGDDSLTGMGGLEFEKKKKKNTAKEEKAAVLDSVLNQHFDKLETNRTAFLRELEAALSSPSAVATSNVVPPVQTLVDYTAAIIGSFSDLRSQLQKVETDLSSSVKEDQSQLEALKETIEGRNAQLADAEQQHTRIVSDLKSEADASRQQVDELAKQLEAQRMEFGMYQNATKTKISELGQHKKILKREVIELRKKIDDVGGENTSVAHEYGKIKSSYQSIKDKNSTLERYIARLEKQVGVQQNMMEMMSQTGGASLIGKIVGQDEIAPSDSKDAISLSGISIGSNYRKMERMQSSSDAKSSHTPIKHRHLLPPDSKSRNVSDVSPMFMPNLNQEESNTPENNVKSLDQIENDVETSLDDRDPSTAYYQSESSSPGEEVSPPETTNNNNDDTADVAKAVPQSQSPHHSESLKKRREAQRRSLKNSKRSSLNKEDLEGPRNNGSDVKDPIISLSGPTTPENVEESRSIRAAGSKTPIQSNSNDQYVDDEHDNTHNLIKSPTLDSGAEHMLNVNASTDEEVKVISLNDQLLKDAAGTQTELDDDDMDDNASRVSDMTEDRTQRMIDDDLAERRRILLAYVNKTGGGSISLSNASTQRRLETIENMLPKDLESTAGESRASSGRLSVAQRARLDAENKSNTHQSSSPTPGQQMMRGDSSVSSSQRHGGSDRSVGTDTVGRSGSSFLKRLGEKIEKAVDNSVLGVGPLADDNESDYYDESESEVNTSVISEASVSWCLNVCAFCSTLTYHLIVMFFSFRLHYKIE